MKVIVISHCGLTRLSLEIITKGVKYILDKHQDINVELYPSISNEIISNSLGPGDVIIIDDTSSIQVLNSIEQIRTLSPSAYIMAFYSTPENSGDIICLLESCDGMVCKAAAVNKIEAAIAKLLSSQKKPKKFDQIAFSKKVKLQLTPKENEVLEYILSDLSNGDISRLLDMKSKTVSAHRRNIYNKLGVKEINGMLKELLTHK